MWFEKFHPEKLPSARERYVNEIKRVTGVLDGYLAKQEVSEGSDGPWLVGGRVSYADLAFINWQVVAEAVFTAEELSTDDYPHVKDWMARMKSREDVKKVLA